MKPAPRNPGPQKPINSQQAADRAKLAYRAYCAANQKRAERGIN